MEDLIMIYKLIIKYKLKQQLKTWQIKHNLLDEFLIET